MLAALTAGTAGAALLKAFAPILEVLFNAFGKSLNDWLAAKRAEQTNRDLGRAETTSTINRESADAERRASDVAINQPELDDSLKQWSGGKPF